MSKMSTYVQNIIECKKFPQMSPNVIKCLQMSSNVRNTIKLLIRKKVSATAGAVPVVALFDSS